ncbi:16281_t:CDS:2 [Racocetra fulgida]|uniref:16281_t:CDS:1 n=1 Tax=Racocetra fulgida TaxID=60492 RepID=A0A9N9AM39_9GLOM|nr:16281_t:CDS:2 [Racocetra fulgida]
MEFVDSTQSIVVDLKTFSFSIASGKELAIPVKQSIITSLITHLIKVLRACIYLWNLQGLDH